MYRAGSPCGAHPEILEEIKAVRQEMEGELRIERCMSKLRSQ
jgi:hypothetical protein